MANSIVIELELDESGAIKGLKEVEDKAKKSGKKAGKAIEDGIGADLKKLATTTVGLGAALAGVGAAAAVFAVGVRAAQVQEQAVDRLNQQLKLTGEFTRGASEELQEYAASLQQVSEFGDEAIIDQIALAKSFGATNEQAKQIASTAIDLSKSFGISLESATRNAAKTLGGFAGELGEVIPELKNLTQEQLQAGEGINLLQRRFNGAGKNLNTFSFATTQASNAFGDLLEEIGNFAVKNEGFIGAIKSSIGFINDFSDGLKGIRALLNIEAPAINELQKLDRAIAANVDRSRELDEQIKNLERRKNILPKESIARLAQTRLEFKAVSGEIRRQIALRKALIAEIQKPQDDPKPDGSAEKRLTDQQLFAQASVKTEEQIAMAATARQEAIEELRNRDLISKESFKEAEIAIEADKQAQLAELERINAERTIETNQSITDAVARAAKSQQTSFVALGKTINNVAVQGFGNAFQNIGKALAEGGNAAEAFVSTIKSTFGDIASAIGDFYIKRGIAQIAAGDPGGAGVLAAGAGLKVLAGILGATASGGSGGGAAPVQQVGATVDLPDEPVGVAEPQQEQQVVNQVVVNGDVFDSEETGLRIFEIISDQSEKNGNVIVGGAFA